MKSIANMTECGVVSIDIGMIKRNVLTRINRGIENVAFTLAAMTPAGTPRRTEELMTMSSGELREMRGNTAQIIKYLHRLDWGIEEILREYDWLKYDYVWHVINPYPSKGRRRKIKLFRKFFKGWKQ